MHRCKDERLAEKLRAIRTAMPHKKMLRRIADRKHRAWMKGEPNAWDIKELLDRTQGKTTIVTCTRRGAAK
eukprot:5013251-Heterocapsa_arctica.AAC.1